MSDTEPFPTDVKRSVTWREVTRLVIFSLTLLLGLVLTLTFQFLPSRYQLNEGDVCPYDIPSPVKVSYISAIKTQEAKDQAVAAVSDLYTYDSSLGAQQSQKASVVLRRISEIRGQPGSMAGKVDSIKGIPNLSLSATTIDEVLTMSDADWQSVSREVPRVLEKVMAGKIGHKDLVEVNEGIPALVSDQVPERQVGVISEITRNFVQPNFTLDFEGTEKAKREARDAVAPVRYSLEKGEMILRKGDIVRAIHLEQLEAAGLTNPTLKWQDIAGATFLVMVLVTTMGLFLYFYRPAVVSSERRLLLLAIVLIVAVVAAKLVIPGREIYGYLFPAAAVAMLVATLLDAELAVLSAIVVSVLMGLIANSSLEMTTLALVGGLVGTLGARRMERLNSFFITGGQVALANFLVVLGFHLSTGELDFNRLATLGFVSVVNGALCAALTLGTFSALGHVFGITTSLGLLELAHPTHPLFRRLLTEAPGTYHHSVVVANLSERAAQLIGADALLARVGAYYHDIGKVAHPYFFIENQFDGHNVHDMLDPRTSVQSIAAHVSDGLELARRHGLPSKVYDMIEQHHGTSLVRYFYHQACQESKEAVSPEDFSYPGPKPQTREAAILMLADSVEAMVRANRDHSPERIEELVNRAVADRLAEGQLDECDLTIRDLETIRRAFAGVLQGIYHPRITYPEFIALPNVKPQSLVGGEAEEKGWAASETRQSPTA
ncbi:MAG: HD family phosphohydrolase [Chloroflexota bacterium]